MNQSIGCKNIISDIKKTPTGLLWLGAKDIILEEDRGTLSGIRTSLNVTIRLHGLLWLGAKDYSTPNGV